MNDYMRVEPDIAMHDELARCKRDSLREQALRATWQLGALARRVEHEAPEVFPGLRDTVAVLQQLSERLVHDLPPGSPRQGELF